MDLGAPFIAHGEAAEAAQPGQSAFHHPAPAAQPLPGLDAAPGDARDDAALAARGPAEGVVVALVGVQLDGPLPGAPALATHRPDRVEQGSQLRAVVDVGRREPHRERDASGVDHQVALAARFAAIRRIRADRGAPPLAATLALSSAARDQSSWSAACKRRRSS